ncbi:MULTISPECIES: hypothetical protein [unclassified Streptomyces]|uniref:hypothetical protein n=1 Tax=unclassified Streptomyces TaxID=2593676 RepID=UPI002DD8B56C|nr:MULTISPECIES: hypothetical protein [unclassified Streptomyces]WSA92890.1 hypothetical protein OIE63_15930 [Streptomyces sp. NBC_01795]WSB77259.1 hypothetical protein OHB04_16765 [Streptomyces sp. NBC_01775]WSS14476.1 hypothetical protein OG533_23205 [Streptomyces sp. NBC_01186]WSS43293.1 hypothetical protein OG220_23885 [Streptomyces sp. NBC_01187]
MTRLAPAAGVLAAAAALVVLPVNAASAAGPQTSAPRTLGACAELTEQGAGWASLRNDCGVEIDGSVQLSAGTNPACVTIAAGDTVEVTWKGSGVAEYAYDCVERSV